MLVIVTLIPKPQEYQRAFFSSPLPLCKNCSRDWNAKQVCQGKYYHSAKRSVWRFSEDSTRREPQLAAEQLESTFA